MKDLTGDLMSSKGVSTGKKPATPHDGRSRILVAALELFSSLGFEGAGLRQIATHAGVQHQLVVYHFKNKENLWNAVVSLLIEEDVHTQTIPYWQEKVVREGPAETLRSAVRALTLFIAHKPEFHRLVSFEGQTDSTRLRWLVKTYIRPYYEFFTNTILMAQQAGVARPGNPGQLYYATLGLLTMSLVSANEYRMMTGLDPFAPEQIETLMDLACDLLGLPATQKTTGISS
jgi:TetR/AcrR family transcriptional regulator